MSTFGESGDGGGQQQQQRMDVKKASSHASRRAMNERRHEMTQRIRKTKRSHLVTLKRRFSTGAPPLTVETNPNATSSMMEDATANNNNNMMQASPEKQTSSNSNNDPFVPLPTPATSNTASLADLAWTYIKHKDSPSLIALQTAMARHNANVQTDLACLLHVSDMAEPLPSQDTPALQLANTLGFSLLQNDEHVQLMSSRVLTNLAATITTRSSSTSGEEGTTNITSPSSGSTAVNTPKRQPNQFSSVQDDAAMMDSQGNSSSGNYYGWQTEGWCDVLIHSKALDSLMTTIKFPRGNGSSHFPYRPSATRQSLHQQSCWALGNICGDSSHARSAIYKLGIYEWLVENLQLGLEWNDAELSRNAAWAITNLIRSTDHNHYGGFGHMSSQILTRAMMSPTLQTDTECGVTWWEVAYEACWILAFLTSKDDTVVQGLMNASLSTILEALACRLESATKIIRTADSIVGISRALQMCIPCLRSLGNIATSCQGAHVPSLLQVRSSRSSDMEVCLVKCLGTLIDLGSYPAAASTPSSSKHNELATVAVEAAWAAGSLLCDAGLPDHLSSTQAAPFLIPVLSRTVTSEYAKLPLKREAMSALWNSVAAPPGSKLSDMGHQWSSRPIRDDFLKQILLCDDQVQNQQHQKGIVASMVEMMVTFVDADGVFYATNVMNAMLRRLGEHHQDQKVLQLFREANGVDALEAICDHASQVVYTSGAAAATTSSSNNAESSVAEQSAELAADLIDDLFDTDENDFGGEDEMTYEPQVKNGQYTFGLGENGMSGNTNTTAFDFSGNGNGNGMNATAPQPQVNPSNNNMNMPSPQGRGRGKVIPAWMQQQQPQTQPPTASSVPMSSYPW